MNKYTDYHTRRRQIWLARQSHDLGRLISTWLGRKNQHGIGLDELTSRISDWAAAIIVAVMIYGLMEYY